MSRRRLMVQTGKGVMAAAMARVVSPALGQAATQPSPMKTNVLLLMSDEHHPNVTSVGGHPVVQTPNIQRLAQAGTVFDNAYCSSPLCSPSRSSFLSGRRVHDLHWYNNCNQFERNDISYGAVLKQQNIHTALSGKTDYYEPADKIGFSDVLAPADRKPPGDTEMRRNPLAIREGAFKRASAFGPHDDPFRGDEKKMAAALDWIKTKAPAITTPWTLTVNLEKPHFPHYVTKELWDQYAGADDLPKFGRDEPSANHPRARDLRDHFQTDQFTDDQIKGLRRGYLGCVTYIDQQLGKLLDALTAIGQLENTVVIYASDHGDMLGKFGMWWKCSLYDDSARVPLIAMGPGFGAGQRVKTPVQLLDLQASIFHAVGANRPADWVGSPLQTIAPDDPDRVVFSEYHGHGTRASSYLIRRGEMKLIYHVNAPHQLFDLKADPDELHNLYGDKPAIAKDLESELRKICDPERENDRAEEMIRKQLAAIPATKGPGAE